MSKPVFSLQQVIDQITRYNVAWSSSLILYTFPTYAPSSAANEQRWQEFSAMSAEDKTAVRVALGQLSEITNLKFEERAYSGSIAGTISFARNEGDYGTAWRTASTRGPDGAYMISQSEVWIGGDMVPQQVLGALRHEIGHAVGIDHPGDYNLGSTGGYEENAVYYQDSLQYTIMTYWNETYTGASFINQNYRPSTYLLHDIASLQALYGANMSTRAGDTVYGFNTNAGNTYDFRYNRVMSIWDGGGRDTLDFSGFTTASQINLIQGGFSSMGGATFNLSVAYGAVIEDAVGGSGNDTIIGNSSRNIVDGGAGNDRISGGGNGDTLTGAGGADTFIYYSVSDSSLSLLACGPNEKSKNRFDILEDFVSGTDRIDLGPIDARLSSAENDAFTFIGEAAFSGSAGQLRYLREGGLIRIEGDVDGDRVADLQLYVRGDAIMISDFLL